MNLDKQYTNLLQDILDNGFKKGDRTGTGTISTFGKTIRHKMSDGFPLLTTKKMHFKGIVTELLWFLRGDTNIKYLVDNGCNIWVGDAYKRYKKEIHIEQEKNGIHGYEHLTEKSFIDRIKIDDEFAKKWGELGPIYGKQWRRWQGWLHTPDVHPSARGSLWFDQIGRLIHDLKTNPDSRRMMVNAWNVVEINDMVLPPCHYGFQVYTRELSLDERLSWMRQNRNNIVLPQRELNVEFSMDEWFKPYGVPKRAISLMWNQRSVDTPLGLPFNIASYGILLEILGKICNMVPDELIGNLGDTHIYQNQVEGCIEQIGRDMTTDERIDIGWDLQNDASALDFDMCLSNSSTELETHEYLDEEGVPTRTREPFPLPKLTHMKTDEFWKTFDLSMITHLDINDFQIEGYQSHPTIKFPLSN